jgi:hypothetical protein
MFADPKVVLAVKDALGITDNGANPPPPQSDPVPVSTPATDSTHCVDPPSPESVTLGAVKGWVATTDESVKYNGEVAVSFSKK